MKFATCLLVLLFGAGVFAESPRYVIDGGYFAVIVTDIETATTWYGDTLGLEETSRLADEGRDVIVNLGRPGLAVELLQLEAADTRPEGYVTGPFKIGMLVADLDAFMASLPAGIDTPRVIEDEKNGLLLVQIRDPDGNIVQVMQRLDEEE